PVGQVDFRGGARVVEHLPDGTLHPNVSYAFFKFVPGQPPTGSWVRVNPGVASFDPAAQTVTLNLKDDGVVADGDEDGVAGNGTILDPGLRVRLTTRTVHATAPGGPYTGAPSPAMATVAGVDGVFAPSLEGVAPTLDYQQLDASGSVIADLHDQAPTAAGSYQV